MNKYKFSIAARLNNWFNQNLGWFFKNGRKQYNIDTLPNKK